MSQYTNDYVQLSVGIDPPALSRADAGSPVDTRLDGHSSPHRHARHRALLEFSFLAKRKENSESAAENKGLEKSTSKWEIRYLPRIRSSQSLVPSSFSYASMKVALPPHRRQRLDRYHRPLHRLAPLRCSILRHRPLPPHR